MVKILAPVSTLEAARRAISGGVDEIYCGVEVPGVNYIALATRPAWCSLLTYDELASIVSYAHEHGVKVALTTEFPFIAEFLQEKIQKHINACVAKGIDALIATDIGIILLAKNMRLGIPIYASTYIAVINYEAVDLLKQLGVKRVMLERHLTIDEMRQIVDHSKDIEIEVFVHGPGCSNINVNCYGCGTPIIVDPKFANKVSRVETLCQTNYDVYKGNGGESTKIASVPILDAYSWCALCQLPDLVNAGVTHLKIVGREFDPDYQAELAKIYRELADLLERGQTEEFQKRAESVKNSKYFADACKQKRCYYANFFHAPYKIPAGEAPGCAGPK